MLRGPTASGLPSVSRGSMIVADGVIAITGSSIVREPLVSMRINVRCPYTPQLTREYMLFIDPAGTTPQPVSAPVSAPIEAPVVSQRPAPAPQPAVRRRPVDTTPIGNATRYRVQPGDTLSDIAQRIENRPVGLWPAVNEIFDANPDAFLDNDVNKLKAGSWLNIPDFGADAPMTVADTAASTTEAAPVVAEDTTASVYEPTQMEPVPVGAEEPVLDSAEPVVDTSAESPLADLQPGDVILDSENPFASTADSDVVIPDTLLDAPEATSSQPNVPVAVIQAPAQNEPSSTNWLVWLVGGGVALIAGLLLFGRFRDRFGSAPIGAVAHPQRRSTDGDTERFEALGNMDMDIVDDSPTAENLALDADLEVGAGLEEGSSVDVTEDFAFASTASLDFELPEEMSSGEEAQETPSQTDIIPPLNIDPDSILESEVLPDDDDDYDMSVIVDATKMPNPEDVTERDLEAIAVPDDDDETLITGDYTVSQEVDYKILEQDYEDELTATQALNQEIQKAAEELATRMSDDDEDDTKEMSLASVHELDVTAQMRGRNDDDIGDDDDTGVNPTVNMEAEDKTVEMAGEDGTVEMERGDGDKTAEMEIESGKVDTKAG